jgi:hypothetical protein
MFLFFSIGGHKWWISVMQASNTGIGSFLQRVVQHIKQNIADLNHGTVDT